VDLTGKTVIVTGGNSGIGLEAARHFLNLGSKVILAVRDEAKGKAAAQDLTRGRELDPDYIQVWTLNMSDYESILAFAEKAKALDNLDIVVLNAAVIKATEAFGPIGYEESFQTNYLSTTLLLLLFIPIVKEKRTSGGPGRISITSSDWASWATYNGSGSEPILPQFKKSRQPWDGMNTYGIGKLFNQLFVSELVKHLSPSAIIITHPDPGMNKSSLGREASGIVLLILKISSALLAREPSVGSRTLVHSVTTVGEAGQGQYVEDDKIEP
jgi:NAD(P)-dependent dehydrogenase (short-subunit alcohol dehydrogenase family)